MSAPSVSDAASRASQKRPRRRIRPRFGPMRKRTRDGAAGRSWFTGERPHGATLPILRDVDAVGASVYYGQAGRYATTNRRSSRMNVLNGLIFTVRRARHCPVGT